MVSGAWIRSKTQNTHICHHKRIRTNFVSNKLSWNRHWPLRPFALLHRISEETGVEFRRVKSCSGGLLPVLNIYLKLKNKCLHFCVQTVACMHWVQHLAPKLRFRNFGFPAWFSLKELRTSQHRCRSHIIKIATHELMHITCHLICEICKRHAAQASPEHWSSDSVSHLPLNNIFVKLRFVQRKFNSHGA